MFVLIPAEAKVGSQLGHVSLLSNEVSCVWHVYSFSLFQKSNMKHPEIECRDGKCDECSLSHSSYVGNGWHPSPSWAVLSSSNCAFLFQNWLWNCIVMNVCASLMLIPEETMPTIASIKCLEIQFCATDRMVLQYLFGAFVPRPSGGTLQFHVPCCTYIIVQLLKWSQLYHGSYVAMSAPLIHLSNHTVEEADHHHMMDKTIH